MNARDPLPLTTEQIAALPVFIYGTLEHDDHLRRIRDRHTGEFREHSYWVVHQGLNLEHKTLCISHVGHVSCSMWDL